MTGAGAVSAAELGAARLILDRMDITAEDLLQCAQQRLPVVAAAVSAGTRRVHGSYWNRIVEQWGQRHLDDPTPSEIKQLSEHMRTHIVKRRNGRCGRCASEHAITVLRCLYNHAVDDGLVRAADNPAMKVAKPRRLPSNRRAVAPALIAGVNDAAASVATTRSWIR